MSTNLKLATKLMGGFGIVLILLAAVIGIYQYSTTATTTGFQTLMQEEVAIADHAGETEALMLQCRRNEKDFLLRRDKKYVDRLEKNITALEEEAHAIVALARQSGNPEAEAKALAVIGAAGEYVQAFKGLVAAMETRGLDHKSGLQGKFRAAAHALAEATPQHEVADLHIAMLQMRRYEKDYLRTESDKYKKKFLASIAYYEQRLADSGCEADAKTVQQTALGSYRKAFEKYLAPGASADLRSQSYQTMRSAAHTMEEALGGVYVPGAKALLLDIRKHEKDYLLRGDEKYVQKTHAAIAKLLKTFKDAGVCCRSGKNSKRLQGVF